MDERTFNSTKDRLLKVKHSLLGAKYEEERASIDKAISELYHEYKKENTSKSKWEIREDDFILREREKEKLFNQYIEKLVLAKKNIDNFITEIKKSKNLTYRGTASFHADVLNKALDDIYVQYLRIS